MDQPPETRPLRDYLRVLRARRRLILVTTLVAAGAALVYSLAQPPVYKATSTISFNSQFFPPAQRPVSPGQPESPAAAAGLELVTREDVLRRVSRALGDPDLSPEEVRSRLNASIERGSSQVDIEAEGDTGDQAAETANESALQTQIVGRNESREYYSGRASFGSKDERAANLFLAREAEPVEIVRSAVVPASPASPKPLRNTLIAGFFGLLLGIGVAFLRHSLDRRVRDAHELQRELGLPLLGYVRSETLGIGELSPNGGGISSEEQLDAFRILRTNVDFLAGEGGVRTVAITSPLPEEGKSTVSAGYAYVNALAGRRALLVECDFRRPVLADRFGFAPSPGLSDHLLGQAEPGDVLRSIDVEGPSAQPLPMIPAGVDAVQPAELIASHQFKRFLAQIAKAYEIVVLDCAPLLPVGDALELLPQVDGVLLCIRIGQTTREQAIAAKEAMSHLPDRPTGLVITGLGRGGGDDYYGYYSHPEAGVGSLSADR
jgi:tyrosine-protein kinase